MSKRSAFENETLTKHGITPYKSPYDIYKHKSKPKAKVKPKAVAVVKPKTAKIDLVQNAIDDRERRYKPYSAIAPLGK